MLSKVSSTLKILRKGSKIFERGHAFPIWLLHSCLKPTLNLKVLSLYQWGIYVKWPHGKVLMFAPSLLSMHYIYLAYMKQYTISTIFTKDKS